MPESILLYGFLSIFFATAIMALASIPGWIKIPEWYRKKLFIALILEVVGATLLLFRKEFLGDPEVVIQQGEYRIFPSEGWIGFKPANGELIRPEIRTEEDTIVLGDPLEAVRTQLKSTDYKLIETESGFQVQSSQTGETVGKVSSVGLKNTGLFNNLRSGDGTVAYKEIKFDRKGDSSPWVRTGSMWKDTSLDVEMKGNRYVIHHHSVTDDKDDYLFHSKDEVRDPINEDTRLVHFFQDGDSWILIRIVDADLRPAEMRSAGSDQYVHFVMVRLTPELKLN